MLTRHKNVRNFCAKFALDLDRHMQFKYQCVSKEKTKGKEHVYKGKRPVSTEKTKLKEGGSKGKRPLRYPCDLCSKVYNRQCDLQAYVESEHYTGKPLVPILIQNLTPKAQPKELIMTALVAESHFPIT